MYSFYIIILHYYFEKFFFRGLHDTALLKENNRMWVNALLESKCTPALIDEEVKKIWLADNTRLIPRKQIRSKDWDAARIVLYNRHREEISKDVEIRRQTLRVAHFPIWLIFKISCKKTNTFYAGHCSIQSCPETGQTQ